jgi:hypothetical protein
MAADPINWHHALAHVTGALVRGEQRIATHEPLTVHLGVPITDQNSRRLRPVMHGLGWQGPRRMRWGTRTTNGYWRHPTAGPPAIMQREPVLDASDEKDTLAIELEAVTRLGLQKLDHILRLPTDLGSGTILRAHVTAATTAVNAQLKADEAKMRQVQKVDVMPRLLELIKIEEAKLAEMDRAQLEKEGYTTLPEKNGWSRLDKDV